MAPRSPRGGLVSQGQPEHGDPLSSIAEVSQHQQNAALRVSWHPGDLLTPACTPYTHFELGTELGSSHTPGLEGRGQEG